jgi:hypothetical protein
MRGDEYCGEEFAAVGDTDDLEEEKGCLADGSVRGNWYYR